jgi:hypothetical protein
MQKKASLFNHFFKRIFGVMAMALVVFSSCQSKINPEITQDLNTAKAELDSVEVILSNVDMEEIKKWESFINHRYRFFYSNYDRLAVNDTLLDLLNHLEASKKMVGKMAAQGSGLFRDFEYCKSQLTTLMEDYSNGLLPDSVAEAYLITENNAIENLSKKVRKRALPMPYYVNLIDSIAPKIDSAMQHYEIQFN